MPIIDPTRSAEDQLKELLGDAYDPRATYRWASDAKLASHIRNGWTGTGHTYRNSTLIMKVTKEDQ
jgi:hypothetical protein